jgi:coenzyme PQQ synthesis protein D (PqqD)
VPGMLLPHPKPNVIYRSVAEGAVLLSTTEEVYYGLNAVGAHIWERLPPVLRAFDDLCASVSKLYPEVDPDTIRADTQELLDDLLTHGLVCSAQQEGCHAANETPGASQAARAEPGRVG